MRFQGVRPLNAQTAGVHQPQALSDMCSGIYRHTSFDCTLGEGGKGGDHLSSFLAKAISFYIGCSLLEVYTIRGLNFFFLLINLGFDKVNIVKSVSSQ